MALIVADSDVLIDALHGKEPATTRIAGALRARELATTVLSVYELHVGARTPGEEARIDQLLGAMRILGLDEGAGRVAARLGRALGAAGHGLAAADCLIAGICLLHALPLATRNRAHFARVPGLRLESW